ncbi:MAG: hypothetical protein HYW01_05380 [Deltaproteobacteria bacterium]|nr:hypothetical protein [Deltaproteobacteria bacterium]
MKLDTRAFAIAVGVVTAAVSTICAFFVELAPEAAETFFGYLFHLDLTGLSRTISWGGFFIGLIGSFLGMTLVGGAVAWLYNSLTRG